MFITRLNSVYSSVMSLISGAWGDYVYRLILFGVLVSFLILRIPYIYGMLGFALFLFFIISPLFMGLFLGRMLDGGPVEFFSSFVPKGTPLWIAPLVCLAETLSYIVRPVVLMIRPFVNLTIGSLGAYAVGSMCFSASWVLFFLAFLFFYEIFVAVVHWFIVCNILSFSEDH